MWVKADPAKGIASGCQLEPKGGAGGGDTTDQNVNIVKQMAENIDKKGAGATTENTELSKGLGAVNDREESARRRRLGRRAGPSSLRTSGSFTLSS